MTEKPFIAGNGVLYVQVNGPTTKPEYLGCHDLGDVLGGGNKIDVVTPPQLQADHQLSQLRG